MKTEITEGIKNHKEFGELRELIVRFKDQGGKQREALQILDKYHRSEEPKELLQFYQGDLDDPQTYQDW